MLEINQFDKIIAANWKLNGSKDFINQYLGVLKSDKVVRSNICNIICPPVAYLQNFSFLSTLTSKPMYLGAQDCSNYDSGAYTGEVSASMLLDNKCDFCIVGHSERRHIFNQTNEDVKIKAEKLINQGIIPIICIGESLEEKNKGSTKEVLRNQITNSLPNNSTVKTTILAYEPIWAIGTGSMPTLEEIVNIHSFLKEDIENFQNYKIIYGGSVNSKNSKEIINSKNVDGVLIGGSSLKSQEFIKIIES